MSFIAGSAHVDLLTEQIVRWGEVHLRGTWRTSKYVFELAW